MPGRFLRAGRTHRTEIPFTIDGEPSVGCDGDTLLVAVLANRRSLRRSEFGDGDRSGFCLMGACQDCWVASKADSPSGLARTSFGKAWRSFSMPQRVSDGVPRSDERPVIVGAGPAGIRAAEALVAGGFHPILVDEGARAGGQIYRRPLTDDGRSYRDLYGTEALKAKALHETFEALAGHMDFRPRTLAWNLHHGALDLLDEATGTSTRIVGRRVILATGGTDRSLPLPGWTLPGVFSLGGAQIALKAHGVFIGSPVAFVGTGPLLYLVAAQYAKAGAKVAAVVETASWRTQLGAAPGLFHDPSTALRGIGLLTELVRRRIPFFRGARDIRFEGSDEGVAAVTFRINRGHRTIPCDAVGMGFGIRSEWQLAELAGVPLHWSDVQQQWVPKTIGHVRTPVDGIYLAGDGAGIAGADAAELRGELAALSLMEDMGRAIDRRRQARLRRSLDRIWRFRSALDRMYPVPVHLMHGLDDAAILCRCEVVRARDIRQVLRAPGAEEVNRAKAFSRVGMGRCQGRMCALNAQAFIAGEVGESVTDIGWLRTQPPIKPLPVSAMATAGQAAE